MTDKPKYWPADPATPLAIERDRLRDRNAQLESLCGELVEALRGLVGTYWAEDQTADLAAARAALAHADTLMENGE